MASKQGRACGKHLASPAQSLPAWRHRLQASGPLVTRSAAHRHPSHQHVPELPPAGSAQHTASPALPYQSAPVPPPKLLVVSRTFVLPRHLFATSCSQSTLVPHSGSSMAGCERWGASHARLSSFFQMDAHPLARCRRIKRSTVAPPHPQPPPPILASWHTSPRPRTPPPPPPSPSAVTPLSCIYI